MYVQVVSVSYDNRHANVIQDPLSGFGRSLVPRLKALQNYFQNWKCFVPHTLVQRVHLFFAHFEFSFCQIFFFPTIFEFFLLFA